MNLIAQLRNPKVQQYGLEILFPIAGYFFWNWSLLIIVVFYLLDFLASQLLYFRRLFFIQKQEDLIKWRLPLSVGLFLILYFVVLKCITVSSIFINYNSIKPYDELMLFAKEELWFLFPVILLSYFMMDKMFFYMPRRFMNHKTKLYFIKNLISNSIATVLILAAVFISNEFIIHDLVILFLTITIKLMFDFGVKKRLLKIDI